MQGMIKLAAGVTCNLGVTRNLIACDVVVVACCPPPVQVTFAALKLADSEALA